MEGYNNFIKVAKCTSGNGSAKIIASHLKELDEKAIKLLWYCINTRYHFGVTYIFDEDGTYSNKSPESLDKLFELFDNLHLRKLSGNAALEAIGNMLKTYTREDAMTIVNIINKYPEGISVGIVTFNKTVPTKLNIPVFNVQLATEYDKNKLRLPSIISRKYDGVRTLTFVTDNSVIHYTRLGNIVDYKGIFDNDMRKIYEEFGPCVIDSEVYADTFSNTMKKRGKDVSEMEKLRMSVFFISSITDWDNNTFNETLIDMTKRLTGFFYKEELERINQEYYIITDNEDDIIKEMENAMANNWEGIMIKDGNSFYHKTRSYRWMKMKDVKDIDLCIVGMYVGKNKLSNTLGGLIVAGYDKDNRLVISRIGSGFSNDERNIIWNNKSEYLNKTIVAKFQDITKSTNKNVFSLRFGVYKHARDDKIINILDNDMNVVNKFLDKWQK